MLTVGQMSFAQPVNYTVTVTQINHFEGGVLGPCQEPGNEEYTALVWFDDNVNGTNVGGNCFQCDNNGNCTNNPNTTLGGRNNTCAETINIIFNAWEDDRGGRCNYNINGGFFDNDDDCGCGPATVASINFQNSGPGCTTYGTFSCNASHNVQVEICWSFVNPPPANDDCSGAIAVSAGTTPFVLSEECSGPDITSCTFNDYNDIWYEYTSPSDCSLESLVVDTQGSGFDTALSIWDACGGNEVACNDDSGGLQSSITIPGCISPETTYYIRVSGFNGADGTGVLNITENLDDDPPTFVNCPSQLDINADTNCMAAIPNLLATATADDNCDMNVTITQSPAAGTMVGLGAQTVTLTATDDCTNTTSTCMVSFNVIDGTPPMCVPQNITVDLDAMGNATVSASQIDGGSLDNCGITSTTISAGQTSFSCDDLGSSFTVTLQVMDAAGNTNTCDATVTLNDPLAACCETTAVCQNVTVELDASGQASISTGTTLTTLGNSSTEFSGVQGQDGWFYGSYPGNVPANYTDLPNYTGFVWNNPGVGAILDFPQLDPNGGHPQFEGPAPAVRRWVSDYCGEITIAGDFFDRDTSCGDGAHVRIFVNGVQVYDFLNIPGASVPYSITQMVNPGDNVDFVIDPIFDAACDDTHFTALITAEVEDFSINNGSSSTCGIACLEVSQEDFTCADIGTTIVTLTVTDVNGEQTTCMAEVTVEDNMPPTASNPATVSVECSTDVPTENIAAVTDAEDNCTPTVAFVGDVSDGNSCAETITRTYSVTDQSGNQILVMQTIIVDDTTPPVAPTPPANVTAQCATEVPAAVDLTATDNCDGDITVSPTEDTTSGTCDNEFTLVRTWTFTDACGNSSEVSQTITIDDTTPPTITCPDDVADIASVMDLPTPDISSVVADDNCTFIVTHLGDNPDPTTFDPCLGNAEIVRTYQISDGCNDAVTCEQILSFDTSNCFELSAEDPCVCNNDQSMNGAGDGTFNETLVITGSPNINLCLGPNSIGILDENTNVDISTSAAVFTETANPDGSASYTFSFNHVDAVGYTLELFDCDSNESIELAFNGAMTSLIQNVCYYPVIDFTPAITSFCVGDSPIPLAAQLLNDMPDGMTPFNGSFAYSGTGVTGNIFDPNVGAGNYMITATYTPSNAVGTSTDPDDAICLTDITIEIEVNDLPQVQFTCPTEDVPLCEGPIPLNALDNNPLTSGASTGVWSGTAAIYINDMGTPAINDDVLDPTGGQVDTPLTLILTITSEDGCVGVSEVCTLTIVKKCEANAGRFDE